MKNSSITIHYQPVTVAFSLKPLAIFNQKPYTSRKTFFASGKQKKRKLQLLINRSCNDDNPSSQLIFFKARAELRELEESELLEQAQKFASFHLLNDELPTKAFINIENRKLGYHEITKLVETKTPNIPHNDQSATEIKKTITEPEELRTEMKNFYQNIFSQQDNVEGSPKDLKKFLMSKEDPAPWQEFCKRRIPDDMRDQMEGQIELKHLTESLEKKLKPSSAPGIDGLTIARIRVFWPELKHLVTKAINECKTHKSLTITFRTAIFKLLRKGQKDPTSPGNYRPISLLSAFYKLASSVITDRIKTAIEHVIGISQKAYVSTNNIGSCLINLLSLMQHVNQKKIASIILLLDFRKAFDSISHNFIQTVLKELNFGQDICEWVKLFLDNRCGYILMGGYLTDQINLEQGVPQGDIISPFIFILCVEVLLIKICYTRHITGITYAKREDRCSAYADDATLFMIRTEENLRNTINILHQFSQLSGLHCNLDKTKVVPIGGNFDIQNKICPEINLEWVTSFTILGLMVDQKLEKLSDNFTRIHTKCKTIINSWKGKNLTIQGRITIANTLLLSQYTYYCSALDAISNDQIDKIEHIIYNFIQNNAEPEESYIQTGTTTQKRKKWIPDEIMFAPKNHGGLGCIRIRDFLTGLRVSWIRRYSIEKYDDHWTDLLDQLLGIEKEDRHNILTWGNCSFNAAIAQGKIILTEMLKCLSTFIRKFPSPVENNDNTWLNQSIFNNDAIRLQSPTPSNPNRTLPLQQGDYGLSKYTKGISLNMCYQGGIFKSKNDLELALKEPILPFHYTNLRHHVKHNIGPDKPFPAIPIPNKKVPKHVKQSVTECIIGAKNGSKPYRKILSRDMKPISKCNLSQRWNKKLNTDTITESHIKDGLKLVLNRWIPKKYGDLKARILLTKTQFNNQLAKHIRDRDKFCDHCKKENNPTLQIENAAHALFYCPSVNTIYKQTFEALSLSDHIPEPLTPQDVIVGINTKQNETSPLALINSVIMIVISYIMNCRFLSKKPNRIEVLQEIKTILENTTRTFPKRKLAKELKGLDIGNFLASTNPPDPPTN